VEARQGGVDGGSGSLGAGPVGNEQDFVRAEESSAGPVGLDAWFAHLPAMEKKAAELRGIRCYKEKLHVGVAAMRYATSVTATASKHHDVL
jgi:hypothetical protein